MQIYVQKQYLHLSCIKQISTYYARFINEDEEKEWTKKMDWNRLKDIRSTRYKVKNEQ